MAVLPRLVLAQALSGGDVGTASPLSVKSLTYGSTATPAAYAATSFDRSVSESTVDCTSKPVFELTIVADRAERIVHPSVRSAVEMG